MSINESLARTLDEIARMMELLGEDSFRASAHARAARLIADYPQDIAALAKDRNAILALEGIGPKLADKIIEFCGSGCIKEHQALLAKVPAGLLIIMQIPGLGPKTVRTLWQEGGITDLAGLERAIAEGSLLKLPRMGEKAIEKIKANLSFAKSGATRLWLGRAYVVADHFIEHLRAHPAVSHAEAAGSLRRGKETIGDIDILVALKKGRESDAAAVGEVFRTTPGVIEVLAGGDTKSSVRVSLAHDLGRWKLEGQTGEASAGPSIQVDLRVLPASSWGSALMYFTGSKEHNVRLRELALSKGYTLNEWGLFPEDDEKTPPQSRGVKALAGKTEEEVYAKLGLSYVPPEAREDRGELDRAGAWKLVALEDIRAELHAHTTASDGSLSILELAKEAKRRGFHTIAVTDHSQSSTIANGLKPDRLRTHINAVRAANEQIEGITILAGSEVDILADGSLDYKDDVLALLDIVIASPHAALTQDPAAATARLLKAIANPHVHILGHPTGRLISRRKGLEPDMASIVAAAKQHGVALEVNSHWMRLDLRDQHVRLAVDAGCFIAIDTDAHTREDFDNLRFGVMTARRGWCPPDQCINTWPAKKLHAWLKAKR